MTASRPWLPHGGTRIRTAAEFDDQDIGVLASPAPDLDKLSRALALRFSLRADLDDEEGWWAQGRPEARNQVIAAITALPGGRLVSAALH